MYIYDKCLEKNDKKLELGFVVDLEMDDSDFYVSSIACSFQEEEIVFGICNMEEMEEDSMWDELSSELFLNAESITISIYSDVCMDADITSPTCKLIVNGTEISNIAFGNDKINVEVDYN